MPAPASSQAERVQWLVDHQRLWEGFPSKKADTWQYITQWKALVKQMKEAGLYSKTTYYGDVNLVAMINEARKYRRQNASVERVP